MEILRDQPCFLAKLGSSRVGTCETLPIVNFETIDADVVLPRVDELEDDLSSDQTYLKKV